MLKCRQILKFGLVSLVSSCSLANVQAADHLEAPLLRQPGVGDRDINDVYAFQSPTNPDNSVLVLTVNPFAGDRSGTKFSPDVDYQIQIDTDSDAVADITYSTTFKPSNGARQNVTTQRNGVTIARGVTENDISIRRPNGGGTLRAGLFDDPFFFDLDGFQNGLNFTGEDAFAGANVSAIVLEIPSTELGGNSLGIWGRTVVDGQQVDRMGRPAINTVLVPSGRKDEFNLGNPVNDLADFGADFRATITSLSNADNANALTPILLPDLLTFDPTSSDGFLNGRRLEDDVIDASLSLLTDGGVTFDGVDANDVPFRDVFPYLAPAQQATVPEPGSNTLLGAGLLAIVFCRRLRGRQGTFTKTRVPSAR